MMTGTILHPQVFEKEYAGKKLSFEVSRVAEQANAAVVGSYGDSMVLATVVMSDTESDRNYFPLSVEYEERFYAVGKILGSRFMRREGRPTEEAVLSGRIIDRTIRPLFDQRMRRDVQVVLTILSLDEEDDLDFLALNTASVAIAISDVPWAGPVSGVKIVQKNEALLLNPKNSDVTGCDYQMFAAGPKGLINMIEVEGSEAKEDDVVLGLKKAQEEIDTLIAFQESIVKKISKKKVEVKLAEPDVALAEKVTAFLRPKLEEAIYIPEGMKRDEAFQKIHDELTAYLVDKLQIDEKAHKSIHDIMEGLIHEIVHTNIIEYEKRPDLRKIDEVRELHAEVGMLPRTHGSAFFMRGSTQSLAVATIAPPGQEQSIESMSITTKKRFLLHYNFPQYSVGETGPFRGPGRREIGHGALAEKAIKNMLPEKTVFPYTLRVVSEILSSNGSSSMATVCASTLALMDAGVPLKSPVAGIAMGLATDTQGRFKVLTDLQGYEDHYGDMDFKVAGTKDGVTAIQLDVKIPGLTKEIIVQTLRQARDARLKILDVMLRTLPAPRPELSPLAPLIMTIKVDPSQIGSIIGPGGKVINGIIERTGCLAIDIDDDGTVFISGKDKTTTEAAYKEVQSIVKEYVVGDIVEGTIVKTLDFGAIVDLGGGRDGMIHISEFKNGFVKDINEVARVGDFVRAKVVKVQDGKIGLSIKALQS